MSPGPQQHLPPSDLVNPTYVIIRELLLSWSLDQSPSLLEAPSLPTEKFKGIQCEYFIALEGNF